MKPIELDDLTQTGDTPRRHEPAGPKNAYLVVLSGPRFGELFKVVSGGQQIIGRAPEADIRIAEEGISRRHASVEVQEGGVLLRDLGSHNGTFVRGERVSECVLADGERVQMGIHTTLKLIFADEVEAQYQQRLAAAALRDPLTGLYNRRHFHERLTAEFAAAQRHGRALSLLIMDVDHFKRLNDVYGHLAGDEALRVIARTIEQLLRKEDVLARFGGDEFVVLARETRLEGAKQLGERLRQTIEGSRFPWEGKRLSITVSVGVTLSIGLAELQPGVTHDDFLKAADRALYLAKQSGRNCVVAIPLSGAGQ